MICSGVYPFLTMYPPFYEIISGIVSGGQVTSDNLRNVALQVINLEQRKSLLEQIGDSYWYSEIVHGIVDDEPEVYRSLLKNQRLKRFHLSPLAGKPAGVWIPKALLALEAGYSPLEVSQAVYGSFRFWSGSESKYWAQWVESFEPLLIPSCIQDDS